MPRPLLLLVLGLLAAAHRAQSPAETPAPPPAPAATDAVHVFLVGDVMLGDAAQKRLERRGYDLPFRAVKRLFREADVIVGNLEGPITERTEPLNPKKEYLYKVKPPVARALREFGFTLVSLANNHALDYRLGGLDDTTAALDAEGIGWFGAGHDAAAATAGKIVERKGVRIGFVGLMVPYGPYAERYEYFAREQSAGVAELSEATIRDAVARLRPQVDVLIGCFHWGENYRPVTAEQRELAKLAAPLGFDLIFGHHPHVAQGVEVRDGVPILYSLGNFTFCTKGQFAQLEERWRHGWVADVVITDRRVSRVDLIPIDVDNQDVDYQPRPSDPAVLPPLPHLLNAEVNTPLQIAGDRARLELAPK